MLKKIFSFFIAMIMFLISLPVNAQVILPIYVKDVPNLIRLPMVRQATDHTCGVAALQSVLAYYGIEIREDKLALELNANDFARAKEIKRFAEKQGLKVTEYHKMTIKHLKEQIKKQRPVMVCMQAWSDKLLTIEQYKNNWEDGHWVVIIGYDQKNIYMMDPSTLGHYAFVPEEEFMARWHDYEEDINNPYLNFAMVFEYKEKSNYDPLLITYME